MALSRTVRPRAAALVVAAVAGGTALVGAGVPAGATASPAAPAHAAASTLISVTITAVPALSVTAFQGTYATSTLTQNGGDGSADGTDPNGVLDRITLDRPAQSKTHSDPAKNWADAVPAVEYALHGKKLYAISSVDAHAECATSSPAPAPTTYVHTTPDSVSVLGKSIASGKTTVPVTGAQLGVTSVDHGSLDVTYSTATTQEQQTSAVSAHAHLDLTISGTFYDSSGKQLYSGPVQKVRLGDVQAACQSSGATTPSTSAPTPASSTPISGMPGMPAPGSPSAMAHDSSTAAETVDPAVVGQPQSHHAHHVVKPRKSAMNEPGSAAPQAGPMLPAANAAHTTAASGGGGVPIWWVLVSVLTVASGVGLYFATRRRGSHQ
jgi:hypothetical protein